MSWFAFSRRPIGLAVIFSAGVAAACGDGVTLPGRAAGYYRLVSVNGQALPYVSPPSTGFSFEIWRGDLVLRSDGTYRHGVGGDLGFGFVNDGTYRVSDGELVLSDMPLGDNVTARLSGDSLTVHYIGPADEPNSFTFRRAQLPPSAVAPGRFRLRSINGRTDQPLVAYDTTIGENRTVGYVAFDTLEFSDGVFFRRHRGESAIGYTNGAQTSFSSWEWTTWGAYESGPGRVVLLHYTPPPLIPARDSLSIATDTLVRRTPPITGVHEERYTRP